jgi:hypothetical protein
MMRKMVIVSVASLLLAGCNSSDTGASPNGGEDAQVRLNGEDGKEALNVSIGADLAVDMPKGYTLYPGVMVITKSNVDQGDSIALVVVMASKDSPEKLVSFYRKQAEAAGVEFSVDSKDGGTQTLMGNSPDGTIFVLSALADESGTTAQLTVGVPKDS